MIEQIYELYKGEEKSIKRIIADENINLNHMVLNFGETLPVHYSNSTVYMTVVRGVLTIRLDEQQENNYKKGTVLKIPYNTKMNVNNTSNKTLELIVVKAPAPKA
ncbi:MAG: hypothetical protein EOM87_08065 [Clostridia bacterium]|nr:hypothetical protein [Clostridia bacterium]